MEEQLDEQLIHVTMLKRGRIVELTVLTNDKNYPQPGYAW